MYICQMDISDETIRNLKEENDMLIQRETISEKTIQILTEEIDTNIRKEVLSLKIIKELNEENHMHIQKEVALEENIRKLKKELDMHAKNETVLQLSSETPKDIPEIIFPTSDRVEPSPKQMSIQQGTVSLPSQSSILTEGNQLKDDEVDISQTATEIETGNMQLSVENDILPQTSRPMALVVEDNLIVEAEIVSTTEPDDKEDTASDAKETKEADTDTVGRSIYSNNQLEELVSRLAAPVHLSSPISALSSSALSQNPNVQNISEVMQKLKVLVGKDLDSIMSTTGVVGEISSLLKNLDEIKDHLSPVDFGTFSVVQMVVGRFESDFPNIKLALSTYHDVHQEQQGVLGCLQELIQRRTDVNDKHEELNQRKQQITNRINGLQHDLQEAEKELATVLTEMDINAASGKDIESKINEECPKGASLMTKMSSVEPVYHFALAKKASLAEDWANIQACFLSKSI
ncbi:uncharacterized protein [Medicago truncatula]|uniref:Uncharacterized protein n=1 Tax=Medicago truncatula TaxID=3880 RepID=A0A072U1I1_MEDTR|nr:uncharacterized protein LOC25498858 isoform X3 [Medicago truncatula]KEH23296.1 hypothetical protein MTR_7g073690 [Medicago truncatula]